MSILMSWVTLCACALGLLLAPGWGWSAYVEHRTGVFPWDSFFAITMAWLAIVALILWLVAEKEMNK